MEQTISLGEEHSETLPNGEVVRVSLSLLDNTLNICLHFICLFTFLDFPSIFRVLLSEKVITI